MIAGTPLTPHSSALTPLKSLLCVLCVSAVEMGKIRTAAYGTVRLLASRKFISRSRYRWHGLDGMALEQRMEETSEQERALAFVKRHGWNATSFQCLEPGMRYWFDTELDACVAYADTGSAWVVTNHPPAPAGPPRAVRKPCSRR